MYQDPTETSPGERPNEKAVGTCGIWGQLMKKYTQPGSNYPLGMTSGISRSESRASANPDSIVWRPYEQPLPPANANPAPELIFDANIMQAIAQNRPNTMSVQQASICHDNPLDDYRMTSRPRGFCLIVNNVDFEYDIFPTRRGSDQDAIRFDQLFRQLGFQTVMSRNLTAEQMRNKFLELSAACRPEHDALFIFILSHGSEHGIYGTDGLEVYLESDIISCFDNRNCKAMIGKPKVFVVQACRGDKSDFGGGDTTDSVAVFPVQVASHKIDPTRQGTRVPTSWLPSNQPKDDKTNEKHPIRTDMLLVFSCLAGFVSIRNETAGSWLGVALAYFVMTHAHERDFLKILNLVSSDIIQRVSSNGHFQSVELKLLGWTKNLYFNPGIYR